jgi:hypothetical protein
MTDPPVIADVALVLAKRSASRCRRHQDVFRKMAVALKRLGNHALVLALRLATRALPRNEPTASSRSARRMRDGCEARAPTETHRRDPELGRRPRRRRRVRATTSGPAHDLVGRFVVMHSGNIGTRRTSTR